MHMGVRKILNTFDRNSDHILSEDEYFQFMVSAVGPKWNLKNNNEFLSLFGYNGHENDVNLSQDDLMYLIFYVLNLQTGYDHISGSEFRDRDSDVDIARSTTNLRTFVLEQLDGTLTRYMDDDASDEFLDWLGGVDGFDDDY